MNLAIIALLGALLSGLSAVTLFDQWVLRRGHDTLALAVLSAGAALTMAALQAHAPVAF